VYDLNADIGESQDIADKHPDIVARMEAAMRQAAQR